MKCHGRIGAEFFRWEFATIIASNILGINPFDQPNVESAKILARKMVTDFKETNNFPEVKYNYESSSLKILFDNNANSIKEILNSFQKCIVPHHMIETEDI